MTFRTRLERLAYLTGGNCPARSVEELTDAELLDIIGLGPNPTDGQLEDVARLGATGTEKPEHTP
jgi:hypothetical protein